MFPTLIFFYKCLISFMKTLQKINLKTLTDINK